MKLKVKRLVEHALLPVKAYPDDTGYDVFATSRTFSDDYRFVEYGTGLSVEPEEGWGIKLRPRSSISKYDLVMCNSVATIDHSYRGEIKIRFRIIPSYLTILDRGRAILDLAELQEYYAKIYDIGERIAQMIPEKIESIEVEEVEEITTSIRGSGGFGSTGV